MTKEDYCWTCGGDHPTSTHEYGRVIRVSSALVDALGTPLRDRFPELAPYRGGTFSNAPTSPAPTIADLRRTILTLRGEPLRLMAHAWFTYQERQRRAKWF